MIGRNHNNEKYTERLCSLWILFLPNNHIWYKCSEGNALRRLLLRSGFTREGTCPQIALGNIVFIYKMKGEQHYGRHFTRRKAKLAVQLAGLAGAGRALRSRVSSACRFGGGREDKVIVHLCVAGPPCL